MWEKLQTPVLESQCVLHNTAWEASSSMPASQCEPPALSVSIRNAESVEVICQIPSVQVTSLGGFGSHLLC